MILQHTMTLPSDAKPARRVNFFKVVTRGGEIRLFLVELRAFRAEWGAAGAVEVHVVKVEPAPPSRYLTGLSSRQVILSGSPTLDKKEEAGAGASLPGQQQQQQQQLEGREEGQDADQKGSPLLLPGLVAFSLPQPEMLVLSRLLGSAGSPAATAMFRQTEEQAAMLEQQRASPAFEKEEPKPPPISRRRPTKKKATPPVAAVATQQQQQQQQPHHQLLQWHPQQQQEHVPPPENNAQPGALEADDADWSNLVRLLANEPTTGPTHDEETQLLQALLEDDAGPSPQKGGGDKATF